MQHYRLSNRQQKELILRGQELTIAIPYTDDEPSDPAGFIRESLPELPSDIEIRDAATELVLSRMIPGNPDTVAGRIGAITDHVLPSDICVQIAAVVATLHPPRCRGAMPKIQWPGAFVA